MINTRHARRACRAARRKIAAAHAAIGIAAASPPPAEIMREGGDAHFAARADRRRAAAAASRPARLEARRVMKSARREAASMLHIAGDAEAGDAMPASMPAAASRRMDVAAYAAAAAADAHAAAMIGARNIARDNAAREARRRASSLAGDAVAAARELAEIFEAMLGDDVAVDHARDACRWAGVMLGHAQDANRYTAAEIFARAAFQARYAAGELVHFAIASEWRVLSRRDECPHLAARLADIGRACCEAMQDAACRARDIAARELADAEARLAAAREDNGREGEALAAHVAREAWRRHEHLAAAAAGISAAAWNKARARADALREARAAM